MIRRLPDIDYVIADYNLNVVRLWQAAIDGWDPPFVSRFSVSDWQRAKTTTNPSILQILIGFGLSFGGDWNGGYAANDAKNDYWVQACNSFRKKATLLRSTSNIVVRHASFFEWPPEVVGDALVYCDPPYAETTGYPTGDFDSVAFWKRAEALRRNGAGVFVSEFSAPSSWSSVWNKTRKLDLGRASRVEHLFCFRGE